MNAINRIFLASTLALVLSACGTQEPPPEPTPEPEPTLDDLSIEQAADSGFFEVERVDEQAAVADAAARDPDVVLWFIERKSIARKSQIEKAMEQLAETVSPDHVIVIAGTNYGENPRHIERAGERLKFARELIEENYDNYIVEAPYDPEEPGLRALIWLVDRGNVVYADTMSLDDAADSPVEEAVDVVEEGVETSTTTP